MKLQTLVPAPYRLRIARRGFTLVELLVVVAIIHHNLDPVAATLTVQANSADSWGAPPLSLAERALYLSTAISIDYDFYSKRRRATGGGIDLDLRPRSGLGGWGLWAALGSGWPSWGESERDGDGGDA